MSAASIPELLAASLPSVPTSVSDLVKSSAERAAEALEAVLAVLKTAGDRANAYFSEQTARGAAVVEQVTQPPLIML